MVDIARTLSDALSVDCVALPADDADARLRRGLSMLAHSSFDFQPLEVLGERVLVARPRERMAPARLTRLLDEVGCAAGGTVVCSLPSVTPYLRGVLLGEGRGFVTDDGQAYVPGLLRLMPARRMRPATPDSPRQAVPKVISGAKIGRGRVARQGARTRSGVRNRAGWRTAGAIVRRVAPRLVCRPRFRR